MDQILIEGKSVEVQIKRKRGLKRLTLRIDMKKGILKVSSPFFMSKREIIYFIEEKAGWIEKNINKFREIQSQKPRRNMISGDLLHLQGQEYSLKVLPSDKKRTTVELGPTEIVVNINKEIPHTLHKEKISDALKKFYKNLAKHIINARLEYFNEHYKFKYKKVSIKELKSRWGSCSTKGNLNFNWKLVLAPPPVLDYVVVHELCHLGHMNHSNAFWALVNETVRDHKKYRKWLRDNGHFLDL